MKVRLFFLVLTAAFTAAMKNLTTLAALLFVACCAFGQTQNNYTHNEDLHG